MNRACRNTFQLAMGSDSEGRTFASVCYDNLVWLYSTTAAATHPVAAFVDGATRFVRIPGSDSAATFSNMTCMGTRGVANGSFFTRRLVSYFA
jgi:hypothetical protein